MLWLNLLVSEQGARRMAMESATNNAEEIIAELELDIIEFDKPSHNQREITEIVGGVEALK